MDRRQFITATSAAGISLAAAAATRQRLIAEEVADQKPKRVGLIGCGWYGKCDLFRLMQVAPVEVVSLCDVDVKQREKAANIVSQRQPQSKEKPRLFGDYREMLKEKDLDICLIGTPDHWHALTMIAACEAGADVYCQKPISVDVREGQAMVAAARKHGRVVQVGTQRRSTPHLVEAREKIVKQGLLGKIGYAEVCCYYHMRANGNPPTQPVPDHLDYEMWTGPAPLRPYDGLPHKRWWRTFMEYGNGIVGDMCIHMLDMIRWQLDLGWPTSVSSTGGILVQKEGKSNTSDTQAATFDFGDLKVVWQHRTWGNPTDNDYPWAGFIYGDKGTLKLSVHRWDFIPQGKQEPTLSGAAVFDPEDKYPEDKTEAELTGDQQEAHVLTANRAHQRDFLAAIASRGKPIADIEQGHISTASCILANLSMQLGRSLTWDPAKHEVVGDADANNLLARPYRKPWVHPQA
ncbi:MAG TPA: Gfo/Idh/MocA family oxidoreductase [Pirellulaceae bacterium]|nr:Gfo/Idh/MocA family oxidoreductase [Pirellulaceae bacterium]